MTVNGLKARAIKIKTLSGVNAAALESAFNGWTATAAEFVILQVETGIDGTGALWWMIILYVEG